MLAPYAKFPLRGTSMMKNSLLASLVVWATFASATAKADLILSLSSPDDLSHFAVGTTATFEVSVSGTAADPPGFLSASIQVDPSVLGSPSVTAGSIVPDLSGFDSSATGGGTVSASYDDSIFGTAPITSDGVFYSFTLTRIDAAATVLSFSGFAAQDDLGNIIPITASPDSISIPGTTLPTPEPSSLMLALVGLAMLVHRVCRRDLVFVTV